MPGIQLGAKAAENKSRTWGPWAPQWRSNQYFPTQHWRRWAGGAIDWALLVVQPIGLKSSQSPTIWTDKSHTEAHSPNSRNKDLSKSLRGQCACHARKMRYHLSHHLFITRYQSLTLMIQHLVRIVFIAVIIFPSLPTALLSSLSMEQNSGRAMLSQSCQYWLQLLYSTNSMIYWLGNCQNWLHNCWYIAHYQYFLTNLFKFRTICPLWLHCHRHCNFVHIHHPLSQHKLFSLKTS